MFLKTVKAISILAILGISLSACQKAGSNSNGEAAVASPQGENTSGTPVNLMNFKRSYRYFDWNCSTGLQEFTSRDSFCAALLDEQINNQCARSLRMMTHKLECDANSVATIPEQDFRTSSCSVYGEDSTEDIKLIKSASAQKNFFWNGRSEKIYQLFGGIIKRFGISYVTLKPNQSEGATAMTLNHRYPSLGISTSIGTGVGGRFEFVTEDESASKKFVGNCVMDASFALKKKVSTEAVLCTWKDSSPRSNQRIQTERIQWDRASQIERDLKTSVDMGPVKVRLVPSEKPENDEIQILADDVDMHKRIYVRARLAAGIELRHKDTVTGTDLQLSCAPASK